LKGKKEPQRGEETQEKQQKERTGGVFRKMGRRKTKAERKREIFREGKIKKTNGKKKIPIRRGVTDSCHGEDKMGIRSRRGTETKR